MPCAGICRRGANWTTIGPTLLWSRISIHGRDMCSWRISGSTVVLAGGATNIHDLLRKYVCWKMDWVPKENTISQGLWPHCVSSCSDFPLPLQTLFTSNRPLDMAKIPLSSQLHALTSGNIFWSAMFYTAVPWLLETVSWFQDYWAVNSGFRCYCHCKMQLLFLCFSYILWQVLSNHGQAVVGFLNGHAHLFST